MSTVEVLELGCPDQFWIPLMDNFSSGPPIGLRLSELHDKITLQPGVFLKYPFFLTAFPCSTLHSNLSLPAFSFFLSFYPLKAFSLV